jgi:hypothetical protein
LTYGEMEQQSAAAETGGAMVSIGGATGPVAKDGVLSAPDLLEPGPHLTLVYDQNEIAALEQVTSIDGFAFRGYRPFPHPFPARKGSIGRTTFDDRSSQDGTVTVVLPPENVDVVPSQSLLKITSADKREYIASVTAGPFCEPDGMRADAPALISSAVNRAMIMPRHHGRVQATIIGQRIGGGLTAARHRPKPNSPVHSVPDAEMAEILNLKGELRLGLVYGHDTVEVRIPSHEKSVLPRHTGVVGTTGGGKSTGIGRYIAGLHENGVCTFLFDVELLPERPESAGRVSAEETRCSWE